MSIRIDERSCETSILNVLLNVCLSVQPRRADPTGQDQHVLNGGGWHLQPMPHPHMLHAHLVVLPHHDLAALDALDQRHVGLRQPDGLQELLPVLHGDAVVGLHVLAGRVDVDGEGVEVLLAAADETLEAVLSGVVVQDVAVAGVLDGDGRRAEDALGQADVGGDEELVVARGLVGGVGGQRGRCCRVWNWLSFESVDLLFIIGSVILCVFWCFLRFLFVSFAGLNFAIIT